MSDYDSAWKEALESYFRLFLAFFFPDIHNDVDWTTDHETLDLELQKLTPEAERGRRHADKLIKVFCQPESDERRFPQGETD
jgi:hypothetical protein